ncbi:MAG: LysM peptidoglycan-binding domain-containing protein [Pyrinomonadaceae bacterium]
MKSTLIFGGVDGTSIEGDTKYAEVFRDSNVHRTYLNWNYGPKEYRRGPNVLDNREDISTATSARAIRDFVVRHWGPYRRGPVHGKAVFLAGYSRGGAAVIETCKFLKERDIPVECLILFDPVDRTLGVGGIFDTPICDNVRNVIHIIRSPAAASRESFGNCGKTRESWTKTKGASPVAFLGTHAAMGGTLWPDPPPGEVINEGPPDGKTNITADMDRVAFSQVRAYFQRELRTVLDNCLARMEREGRDVPDFQVTPVGGGSLPSTGQVKRYYVVKPGDWLSKIAQQYYGDPMKYDVIHKANLSVIGPDANVIKPNQRLEIPYI